MLTNASANVDCGASDQTFRECIPSNNCLGEERTFKIVSPANLLIFYVND